jgi:hypothetical protein
MAADARHLRPEQLAASAFDASRLGGKMRAEQVQVPVQLREKLARRSKNAISPLQRDECDGNR